MILLLIADARSIHTQRWAEYFAQKGHEVHLITYDPMNRTINGVTEHILESRWKNLYLSFWPRQFAINRIVRKIKPDLIHAHFITKYGFHLPFLGNYPKIVTAWGDDILILPPSSRILFFFTRYVLNSVDHIYAVSQDIRNHIIHDFTIPETKVHYLPFGVDTETFSPESDHFRDNNSPVTFFSNRGFLPIYGMDSIVKAFSIAFKQNPNIRLILKGEGSEKEKIKQDIRHLGLEDVAEVRDKTDYSYVTDDLKSTDVFISAAGSDGTPVSLLEAMATGLPCIATSVGGIPEWITDDFNGLLVLPWDPETLAKKIVLLSHNKEKRKMLGRNARATVLERGNWRKLMDSTQGDYLRVREK